MLRIAASTEAEPHVSPLCALEVGGNSGFAMTATADSFPFS